MSKRLCVLVAAALGALGGGGRTGEPKASDKGSAGLAGDYVIVSGEKDGKAIPEGRIKGTTVRFAADEVVVTDVNSRQTFAARYKLEAGGKASRILMTSTLA